MYQPGHLHLAHSHVQPQDVDYTLDIRYEPIGTEAMHFTVTGEIAGKPVDEAFELPRDLAFNFAGEIDHIARRHGLPKAQVIPVRLHKQYDAMFEDIRTKLGVHSGDAVSEANLDRLQHP